MNGFGFGQNNFWDSSPLIFSGLCSIWSKRCRTLYVTICVSINTSEKESLIGKAVFSMMEGMAAEIYEVMDYERFPRDVIPLILINLPIRALLRFKAVAKWWNTLISSPTFVSNHHAHLAAIKQQSVDQGITRPSLLLTVSEYGTGSVHPVVLSLNLENNTISMARDVYESLIIPTTPWLVILGPCLGVFCLISIDGDVTLWNPATREVRTVFQFNVDQSLELYESREGYGFTCVCDEEAAPDFKFVRFYSPADTTQAFEFDTYCLSTNAWTTRMISDFFFYYIDKSPVELNGTLHWYTLGNNDINEEEDDWDSFPCILTYDLSRPSPSVKTIDMLPDQHMEPCLDDFLLTKYDNQYLSFIVRRDFIEYTDIWVMHKYGDVGSWVRQMRIGPMNTLRQVVLSGYWKNLGTFFLFVDHTETVKWVINNTEHSFSPGVQGNVNIFDYAESVMPINGIHGGMQLTHVIHTF